MHRTTAPDMSPHLNLLTLDPEEDSCFFLHDETEIPEEDRSRIRRLDEASCQIVWDMVVAKRIPVSMLAEDGWLCELFGSGDRSEWQHAWNAGDSSWAMATLRPKLPWHDDEQVLFVSTPDYAVSTPFDVFVRYWIAFLFHDEGPLLIHLQRPEVVLFAPNGEAILGRRPLPRQVQN